MNLHPDMMIRPMMPKDIPEAMEIKEAENWNQTQEDWNFLWESGPKTHLVAYREEKVVGTVTAYCYGRQIAWIGMMLVHKDFRRKGIAKNLLKSLIHKLSTYPSIKLDATPAGLGLYEKLGFIREFEICRMIAPQVFQAKPYALSANRKLLQITAANLPELLEIDISVFGVDRSNLFEYLLHSKPSLAWMLKDGNQVKAYAFGRKGSNYDQIGPLVADTESDAVVLLSHILSKRQGEGILLDALLDKNKLQETLRAWGFVAQRNFVRMYLGANRFEGKKEHQFGIAGPELG